MTETQSLDNIYHQLSRAHYEKLYVRITIKDTKDPCSANGKEVVTDKTGEYKVLGFFQRSISIKNRHDIISCIYLKDIENVTLMKESYGGKRRNKKTYKRRNKKTYKRRNKKTYKRRNKKTYKRRNKKTYTPLNI